MKNFYLHDADGQIVCSGTCADADFDLQAREGLTLKEGQADYQSQYVIGDELVAMPDKPSIHHVFNWSTKAWVDPRTDASEWALVRRDRDRRLASCDWVVARASESETAVPADWKTYRQALRDITTQADPFNIVWPVPPEQVVVA